MKVTCGACFASLRVEGWLADNVARCPKCDRVVHIPPAGSPDGANAVVLTVEEAAELLRRRAGSAPLPSVGDAGPAEPSAPRGPKTEPLPAHLRQAAPAIHEEPQRHKTRPLPRPTGRPSPVLSDLPAVGGTARPAPPPYGFEATDEATAAPARRAGMLTPLVPAGFIVGLIVGVAIGWMIGARGPGQSAGPPSGEPISDAGPPQAVDATPPNSGGGSAGPSVPPPVAPVPPVQSGGGSATPPAVADGNARPDPTPTAPSQDAPPTRFSRQDWLDAQPLAPRATIDPAGLETARRVAGKGERFPATHLYDPAGPGQVYLELAVPLRRAIGPSVTFRLGGPDADCWLVTRDGQVFLPLGAPRAAGQAGQENAIADPAATLTLDDAAPRATARVLFLLPEQLPAARAAFTASQFADLPADALAQADPTAGRSIDGKWEPVPRQRPGGPFGSEEAILAAMAGAQNPGPMYAQPRVAGGFELDLPGLRITGTLVETDGKGYYDASLKMDQSECKALVRLFDNGRQMLIYFGPDPSRHYAFQRSEQSFFGT